MEVYRKVALSKEGFELVMEVLKNSAHEADNKQFGLVTSERFSEAKYYIDRLKKATDASALLKEAFECGEIVDDNESYAANGLSALFG